MPTRLPGARAASGSSARRCTSCPTPAAPGSASVASVEREREPARGVEVGLARPRRAARRRPGRPAAGGRAAGRGRPRSDRAPSMPCSATHSPSSNRRRLLVRGPDPVERHERARVRLVDRALEVDGPRRRGRRATSSPTLHVERADVRVGLLQRRVVDARRGRGRSPGREAVAPRLLALRSARRPASIGSSRPIGSSSSTSCSGVRSIRRWNSHHIALSSRRCQPSSWASSQRACCSAVAVGRIGRDDVRTGQPSTSAWTRACASVTSAGSAASRGAGRGTVVPVAAASSSRRASSQSRSRWLLTTSSRL